VPGIVTLTKMWSRISPTWARLYWIKKLAKM